MKKLKRRRVEDLRSKVSAVIAESFRYMMGCAIIFPQFAFRQ